MTSNRPPSATCSDIFECLKCGECCKGYGGTFLSKQDIEIIAEYVGTDADSFESKFCRLSGDKPVLAQQENGYCIFWDELCTVHPVKPRMCRQWPFIESVLVDVMNWHIMASMCPGIQTDVSDRAIRECVKAALQKTGE